MEHHSPSLPSLERYVSGRRYDEALLEALRILQSIDLNRGGIQGIDLGVPFSDGDERDLHIHFATRFAASFGDLITLPNITNSEAVVEQLFIYHRWSDLIFNLSGFHTSSYLLPRFSSEYNGKLILSGSSLIQFMIIFSPSSDVKIDFDEWLGANAAATVIALLGYLSARSCISQRALAVRERILEWLPGRMSSVNLGRMRLSCIADVYMHCSYAFSPKKHQIKADIIAQMRKACLAASAPEMTTPPARRKRPKIVIVTEFFYTGHSVFRTHSRAVKSLRERFDVIGVVRRELIDAEAASYFDELISYPAGDVIDNACEVARAILKHSPDIVFHLGVGMDSHTIALASLRLAPIQCVSYGHTATTMSPVIDYMILPDDFVGSEDRFSEKVLRLPAEAIPYAARVDSESLPPPIRRSLSMADMLRIAIPASIMKINANFLEALAEINRRAERPVEFAFFPLAAIGLAHYHLEKEILRIVPNSVIYAQSERNIYLERLGACDFFLSPFPYGNMNSIIDAMIMGVPGVCLDGEEAHAHADAAIFRRLRLPEKLIASDLNKYISTAASLVNDTKWRNNLRKLVGRPETVDSFYQGGDEMLFCEAIYKLVM